MYQGKKQGKHDSVFFDAGSRSYKLGQPDMIAKLSQWLLVGEKE